MLAGTGGMSGFNSHSGYLLNGKGGKLYMRRLIINLMVLVLIITWVSTIDILGKLLVSAVIIGVLSGMKFWKY